MNVLKDVKVKVFIPKIIFICLFFLSERADRIRRRAGGGSVTGLDSSEFSENSNTSSTLNDENSHPFDTSDIHQKGRKSFLENFQLKFFFLFSIKYVTNK